MIYRREIDGLRALAVIPVVLFHGGLQAFHGGFIGVDVFFVISGYLITSIILSERKAGTFTIANFYERRARRILPALFAVMIACLPFAYVLMLSGEMKDFSASLVAVSVFSSNVLFWRDSGYFDTASELKPLLHTWSLGVEEQYYLLFPLLILALWRLGKNRIAVVLVLIALGSLGLAHWGATTGRAGAFYLLPTRAWELLLGSLLGWYSSRIELLGVSGRTRGFLAAAGMAMLLYAIFSFDRSTPVPGLPALIPTLGAALIIMFARPDNFTGKLLGSAPLVGVGLISYSLYLWHQPLFAFGRIHWGSMLQPGLALLLGAASVGLAVLSWKFIEAPFRNRSAVPRKTIFSFSGAGSALFVAIGVVGVVTNGYEMRFDAEDRYLAGIRNPDMGRYVSKRFGELQFADFKPAESRRKILIVGDSFAKDLVNAIDETELAQYVQVSTKHIGAPCGNLYLNVDFKDRIAADYRKHCELDGWYEDRKLRSLMQAADEIWLVSNWQEWQVDLLPQSVANLQKEFGKRVLVFGKKNFGVIDLRRMIQTPLETRIAEPMPLTEEHVAVNSRMKALLPPEVFLDVSALLCGDEKTCPAFSKGNLVSYDGGHLTPAGARYFGERLLTHPLIKPELAKPNAARG